MGRDDSTSDPVTDAASANGLGRCPGGHHVEAPFGVPLQPGKEPLRIPLDSARTGGHEQYLQGATADTKLTSYSMAKSLVSLLVGFAIGDGAIASIDDPVTRYVTELAGTSYDGATVKHLLQMSSGVDFSEKYREGGSDIMRLSSASLITNAMPANQYMEKLPRAHPPGTHFNYSTGSCFHSLLRT